MGRWGDDNRSAAAPARAFLAACIAAALALVALPTGASADPRVPLPSCPPELSLAALERAPGGVVFHGSVTRVIPGAGWVRLTVIDWYHRGPVDGLKRGMHPATMDVLLGPDLARASQVIPARMPAVGSELLVVGTWPGARRAVAVTCGLVANVDDKAGAAWLERVRSRYAAFAPTPEGPWPALPPLDTPWVALGLAVAALLLAAAVVETIADARDPLPAT